MKPTVGRIVHVHCGTKSGFDSTHTEQGGPHAAIITKVWNVDSGTVNLSAFPSHGGPPVEMTSVQYNEVAPSLHHKEHARFWCWPPREV